MSAATLRYPRYKRITSAVVLLIAALWAAYVLLWPNQTKASGVGIANGTAAPDFELKTVDGKTHKLSDYKGKVVMLNFFATWCPPCRAEMPSLNTLYNEFKEDDRFVFLFINEDEDRSKAVKYLKESGFTVPLVTRAGSVPGELYSGTLPTTLVLNKEGVVVLKHEGVAGYNTPRFKQQLKDLL